MWRTCVWRCCWVLHSTERPSGNTFLLAPSNRHMVLTSKLWLHPPPPPESWSNPPCMNSTCKYRDKTIYRFYTLHTTLWDMGCNWMWEEFFLHQSLEGWIYWENFKGNRDIWKFIELKVVYVKMKPASVLHILMQVTEWPTTLGSGHAFLFSFSFYLPTLHPKKETIKFFKIHNNGYDVPTMCLQCICIM